MSTCQHVNMSNRIYGVASCLPGVYAHGWVANIVVDHHPPDEEDQQRRDQEVCDARPDHPNFLETKIKD